MTSRPAPAAHTRQNRPNERLLGPETREQGQVDIDCLAGIAPTLQRKAADQAESPALAIAATLEFLGCAIDLKHVRAPS
jgi:hypothetical protein